MKLTEKEKENMLKVLNKNGNFFAKAKEPVWDWMTPFFSHVTISKRNDFFEIEAKIKKVSSSSSCRLWQN